jgi:hypothetical protein
MDGKLNSMHESEAPSWEEVEAYLHAAEPGPGTDDYIDELTERVFEAPNTADAAQALAVALDRAQTHLTRRNAALALAAGQSHINSSRYLTFFVYFSDRMRGLLGF